MRDTNHISLPPPSSIEPQPCTINSHSALENRELFLSSKEDLLIKDFLVEIGYTGNFEDMCFKDPQFRPAISKLSYEWKEFSGLRDKYRNGTVHQKKSNLKEKLELCQKKTVEMLEILNRLIAIKIDSTMNAFNLSQTYHKKAEIISEFLAAAASLSCIISDRNVINSLNRRINQQKNNNCNFENIFKRREHELLTFSCKNDTKLTWAEVFETLIGMENSSTNTFSIPTTELMSIADTISKNIVTHMKEVLLESRSIDVVTKLFPVMYICNKEVDCFVNMHEFFLLTWSF